MGNPKLMSKPNNKIIIPIPPLPIQNEIVRILDILQSLQRVTRSYKLVKKVITKSDQLLHSEEIKSE
jgi:type I restriction enzyme S subunit